MPQWISQHTVSANTPRNHTRTAWLTPLTPRIQAAIRTYVQAHPEGETVTQAVFDAIPPADVRRLLPRGRDIHAGRRGELGLRVPLELIAMYGAQRVETLRRDDGRTASPRRTGKDWPRNYTPHRVRPLATPQHATSKTDLSSTFAPTALWEPILASWLALLPAYRQRAGDLGWWHHTPALLSLLTGAIWRQPEAIGISHFQASRSGHTTPGQADLWFDLADWKVDLAAGLCRPQTAEDAGVLVRDAQETAAAQLRAVPHSQRAPLRYAAVFVVPALPGPGRTAAEAEAILKAAWVSALSAHPASAVATFLAWDDPLALTSSGGYTYPGVMLVISSIETRL